MTAPGRYDDDAWIDAQGQVLRPDRRRTPRAAHIGKDGGLSPSDRRRFNRAAMDKIATLMELDEFGDAGPAWECRIVDLSRGGMGLRSRRMVHEGRFVFVIVEMGGPDTPRKMLCGMVRKCRYSSGEGFAVGVLFRAPPQTLPVKAWLTKQGFSPSLAAGARPG